MTDRDHDWQQAVQDAAGILDARDRERAAEAERAEEAALWASAPEPRLAYLWTTGPAGKGVLCETEPATGGERIWHATDADGRHGWASPSREEAVRLWKAAWVERERRRQERQRADAATAIARETLSREAEASRKAQASPGWLVARVLAEGHQRKGPIGAPEIGADPAKGLQYTFRTDAPAECPLQSGTVLVRLEVQP